MTNIRHTVIPIIIAAILSGSCSTEYRIYVSSEGNDRHPGTKAQPVASVGKAIQTVRSAKRGKATIVLRQGVHYLEEPVTILPSDPEIRFTAMRGEKATVSGARLLTDLQWKPCKGRIMQTKIEQDGILFDRLYVNGRQQPSARYPDFDVTASHYNGAAPDAIAPPRVQSWKKPAGGYLHALHRHEWGGYHWRITGKEENGELQLEGGYQNNRLMGMHDRYRFVENIFEELDASGEWYFDATEKILYFLPPDSVELSAARIETPQLEELFVLQGSEENPVKRAVIENLTLTHTLRTFMNTKEPLLRSDWTICRRGAIRIDGAEHCSVRNCHIVQTGGNAVFFSNYNHDNTVSGCHIEHAGASGICFVGDPAAVRSPAFEYHEFVNIKDMDMTQGPVGNNFPTHCTVSDNLIHDIGEVEKQTAGVHISMSQNIIVSHNTIYRLPRAGINIGDGTWGGHLIEHNDVFDTVLETGDHGAFNSWGRDRFWHPDRKVMDSIVKRYPLLPVADAMHTTSITNNRFRCDHGWDIDLDDGSSNYFISNNVCLNGGIKLREGFRRTVENNIIINNSFHPHVWFAGNGDVFRRNIVAAPYFPVRINDWGTETDCNLFPDEASLNKARANGTDTHSAAGDPMFADPAAGDYRTGKNSKAATVGFINFDMKRFGVTSPRLKTVACQPSFPQLINLSTGTDESETVFMGVQMKNVTTSGERSAAGLAQTTGVWVLEVFPESEMEGALQKNDVILSFGNRKINNIRDLKEARMATGKRFKIGIVRHQKEQTLTVSPKEKQ
ncbi:MAG: PDZ domain-containing protein [Tannerella sp.]|nr:PDZ domain-containing protein [Tannerella sp.]